LYAAGPGGRRTGQTSRWVMKRSAYTRAAMSDVGRLMPLIALGVLVTGVVRSRR
jgi:hypothetical protein